MKLLPFFDEKMSVEKLHIFDIDIYGADTRKISRFKVEEEIFKYLSKYNNCLSSFFMAMSGFYTYSFAYFEFKEDKKELESCLREMKEINFILKIVNKYKESIIQSIINNEQLKEIILEHLSNYRWLLEYININSPSIENYEYNINILEKIKKYFNDNNTNHLTDVAKEVMKDFIYSYYENNKTINLLSKRIIINDDKGNLFTLPENYKMIIDEKKRRVQEEEYDTREIQEFLNEFDRSAEKYYAN